MHDHYPPQGSPELLPADQEEINALFGTSARALESYLNSPPVDTVELTLRFRGDELAEIGQLAGCDQAVIEYIRSRNAEGDNEEDDLSSTINFAFAAMVDTPEGPTRVEKSILVAGDFENDARASVGRIVIAESAIEAAADAISRMTSEEIAAIAILRPESLTAQQQAEADRDALDPNPDKISRREVDILKEFVERLAPPPDTSYN